MPHHPTRIFALDPTHKGFGYAIFELPFRLVEWGRAHSTGDKYLGAVASFERLLSRFRPDTVVLEDAAAPGSRRRPRVRRLIDGLVKLAESRGVAVSRVARSAVLECFSPKGGTATKYSIATRLAKDFPELQDQLPPPRKAWQSEDQRMSIFDALALAVTFASM
jgi:hypothetical protein